MDYCVLCDSKTKLKVMYTGNVNGSGKNIDSIEMLQRCFNLKFPTRNKLGELYKICLDCINRLKDSYKFKQMAKIAQQKLTRNTKNSKDNFKSLHKETSSKDCIEPINKHELDIDNIKREEFFVQDTTENNEEFDDWTSCTIYNEVKSENTKAETKNDNYKSQMGLLNKPERIMDIIQRRLKNTSTTVSKIAHKKVKKKLNRDEDDSMSDCSTKTEEILIATGYYTQKHQMKEVRKETLRPKLIKGALICPMCDEKFINYNLTHQHYVTHFPTSLCHMCGKTTSSKGGYVSHMKTHEEKTDEYVCNPCGKVFKTRYTLHGHIKFTHKGLKAVACYHCPQQFSGSLSRLIHMHKVHNVECKFHNCDKCGSKFYSKTKLKNHENRVHARKLSFVCDLCSRGFVTRFELKEHIVYKHGDKSELPHCQMCNRSFASRKGLKEHMKIHLNIKNYKCPYCDQAFVQKPSLNCHLKKYHKT